MAIIKADNVSIRYITGDFKDIGIKEYVVRKLKGDYSVTEFWADRNVTFQLEKGDMMGIIGTNGAGKSTLLKAVSGIMVPTEGHMEINGNVAALLELASGFDGDLTVRENTYLRGALMGYTRAFMDQMYDEIIAFAELENFQDRPFKHLSSGMKSRLAFSIACLVSPDIIILDEVLSVGDGSFRKKSGDKMKTILDSGVTGILVSHSMPQVRSMCNKILWLDHGKQIAFTDEVELYINAYEQFLLTKKLPQSREDVVAMSEAYKARKRKEKAAAERTEAQKLEAILEAGDSQSALMAALNIVKKNSPDLLKLNNRYLENYITARIDIKNSGGVENNVQIMQISDPMATVSTPQWINKNGGGCVVHSLSGELKIVVRCINDGTLSVALRSKDIKNKTGNRVQFWLDYDYFSVDNDVQINSTFTASHDNPYRYTTQVNNNQVVEIVLKWAPHEDLGV